MINNKGDDIIKKKVKHINKLLYYFSLLTWILNVCFIIIPFFFDISGIWIVGIFISVLIQAIYSGAFYDETLVPKTAKQYKTIDYCLIVSKYISISLAAVGFISLLVGGGSPEIIDEAYCLVNHGDIVRHISEGWFVYFAICEVLLFTCGMLYFSTFIALRIRALYLIQKNNL